MGYVLKNSITWTYSSIYFNFGTIDQRHYTNFSIDQRSSNIIHKFSKCTTTAMSVSKSKMGFGKYFLRLKIFYLWMFTSFSKILDNIGSILMKRQFLIPPGFITLGNQFNCVFIIWNIRLFPLEVIRTSSKDAIVIEQCSKV